MSLLSLPTIDRTRDDQHFLNYVDPKYVIGLIPIARRNDYGATHEIGTTVLLSSGASLETSMRSSQVAAALARELEQGSE